VFGATDMDLCIPVEEYSVVCHPVAILPVMSFPDTWTFQQCTCRYGLSDFLGVIPRDLVLSMPRVWRLDSQTTLPSEQSNMFLNEHTT
jgi:hypothetical protein